MFSLKVTNVAPAGECATFANCARNCFALYCSLLLLQCGPHVDLQLHVFLSPLPDGLTLRHTLNNKIGTST